MTNRTSLSPGLEFLLHFYQHQGEGQGFSYERFNAGMCDCLALAIRFGLHFELDDCAVLAAGNTSLGTDCSYIRPDEDDYALACGCERGRANPSFARSYERWKRKPFCIAGPGTATPTRIYVGREFVWEGARVTATSFSDDGDHVVACSYRADPQHARGYGPAKVLRRYKLTHEALRAANKSQRETARREAAEERVAAES